MRIWTLSRELMFRLSAQGRGVDPRANDKIHKLRKRVAKQGDGGSTTRARSLGACRDAALSARPTSAIPHYHCHKH